MWSCVGPKATQPPNSLQLPLYAHRSPRSAPVKFPRPSADANTARLNPEAFAKHARYELVAEFFDKAVSGASIETRPGFAAQIGEVS